MIPGELLNAFPHRQFHTLPGLLDSWAALPNSNLNACMPMQGGSLYHFYDGLWYDPAERRTHDLPCERRTRYRLSQPDTACRWINLWFWNLALLYFMLNMIFSHTQRVSVTLAITLCPSSASSLSSLSSLSSSLSAWTFLVFRLLLSNRCTDLLQILCGCSLGGPLLSLLKSGCYPYFSWNYG